MLYHEPPARRALLIPLAPTLFLLPLSLDFKAAEAGGLWQYVVTALAILGWVLHFGKNRILKPKGRLWKACHWAILTTIGGSFISLAINGTPLDDYARVFISFALFGMAFFFAANMAHVGRTALVNRLISAGCLTSVAFTVITGFVVTGQDTGEIRYQILSPVLLILEAILLHKILVAKKDARRSALLLAGCLMLQILSVTRSALLAFLVILAVTLWASSPTVVSFVRRSFRIALPGALAIAIALAASSVVSSVVIERWQDRIFTVEKYGVDPTTVSRLAEIKEQMDLWSSGAVSILFGQGYGASYGWSKDFYDVLLDTGAFQLEGIEETHSYFGHSYWVSSLFCGGLLFGIVLPLALIWATWSGLRTARNMLRQRAQPEIRLEICRAGLVLTAMLAMTIGGNPFGTRYAPLIAGAALGSLVATRRRLHDPSRGIAAGSAAT